MKSDLRNSQWVAVFGEISCFAETVRIANISAVGDVAVGVIGTPNREVMDVKNTLSKGTLFTVFLPDQESVKPLPPPSH